MNVCLIRYKKKILLSCMKYGDNINCNCVMKQQNVFSVDDIKVINHGKVREFKQNMKHFPLLLVDVFESYLLNGSVELSFR